MGWHGETICDLGETMWIVLSIIAPLVLMITAFMNEGWVDLGCAHFQFSTVKLFPLTVINVVITVLTVYIVIARSIHFMEIRYPPTQILRELYNSIFTCWALSSVLTILVNKLTLLTLII